MRSDAVGLAVDWCRRDVLLLEHDAETFDVRGVGEKTAAPEIARAWCARYGVWWMRLYLVRSQPCFLLAVRAA